MGVYTFCDVMHSDPASWLGDCASQMHRCRYSLILGCYAGTYLNTLYCTLQIYLFNCEFQLPILSGRLCAPDTHQQIVVYRFRCAMGSTASWIPIIHLGWDTMCPRCTGADTVLYYPVMQAHTLIYSSVHPKLTFWVLNWGG